MTIHPGSSELLAAIPRALDGIAVHLSEGDGTPPVRFGTSRAHDLGEVRTALPSGEVVATFPRESAAVAQMMAALFDVIAQREWLEDDMESMMPRSTLLLEQLSIYSETLPKLSAGDDAEIASGGVQACRRATEARRVVYLGYEPARGCCEVVADFSGPGSGKGDTADLNVLLPIEGFLQEVLGSDGVVIVDVEPGRQLGAPGSPEHLARSQIIGVPITYGSGDRRVVLGALILIDKQEAYTQGKEQRLGNEEVQVAASFAAILGGVFGARKTAELGKELTMARAIQRQILPASAVQVAGFDVAAEYRACGAVGGDYFDYVPLADGRTMVVVADVSGHNLASGMMMVSARAMLRTLALVRSEPAMVFEDLAAAMFEDLTRTERFLTAAGVAISERNRTVEYVSAGHNDMLVYRAATDCVERIASDSTILGFVPRPGYSSRHIELEPGDCLFLFTDGITEALDEKGEMFGDDRLAVLLAQLVPGRTARGIIDGVLHELDLFRHGQVGTDDITAVVIRCVEGRRMA